jgi:hypothetical protein
MPEITRSREMTTSFPFKFVDLGTPLPFKIEANPDFPTETEPVCILNNLGDSGEDTFITFGPNPDPWELTFRWATAGGAAAGTWHLDATLQSIAAIVPNLWVPGFPKKINGAVIPGKWDDVTLVPPFTTAIPPGVFLFRLYATLRWTTGSGLVKVAGRAEGPLVEFYVP